MKAKAFTVVWINPNPPTKSPGRDLVKCGVCGKKAHPFDTLGFYEIVVHPGELHGYEQPLYVCSDKCDKERKPAMDALRNQLNK